MLFACILTYILAIALPSLRISPLLLMRIASIALLYAAALSFNVAYIQSIGSGVGIYSGLFHVTLISQSLETFFYFLGALILMPWSLSNAPQIKEYPLIILFTLLGGSLLLSSAEAENINSFYSVPLLFSVLPLKPSKRLTNSEKTAFTVTHPLTDIIIGLCLGDLYLQRQKSGVNTCLHFKQGICHNEYIYHLYGLFKSYCSSHPKSYFLPPDKRTGKVYSSIYFRTYTLPCFNEFYNLFYSSGKKIVPLNIAELLTPLGLSYWICDDGSFDSQKGCIYLCTNSFSLQEVNLLIKTLNDKWNLNCTINKQGNAFVIRIPKKSLPIIQSMLKDIIPAMMKHKIGL